MNAYLKDNFGRALKGSLRVGLKWLRKGYGRKFQRELEWEFERELVRESKTWKLKKGL